MTRFGNGPIITGAVVVIVGAIVAGVVLTSQTSLQTTTTITTSTHCLNTSNCFPVLFRETGLPANESWQINLGGLIKSSNESSIIYWLPAGTYSYNVTAEGNYNSSIREGTISVSSSNAFSVVNTVDLNSNQSQNDRVPPDPAGIAFNPANGFMYVVDPESGSVVILNGNTVVRTIDLNGSILREGFPVIPTPYDVAYDPANGYMYVTAYNSSSMYVFEGTNLLGTVSLCPGASNFSAVINCSSYGIAFDPATGYMYVTQPSEHQISVLNNQSKVVGTINLGSNAYPSNIAYDPSTSYLYVSDLTANNITIVKNLSVIGSFSVGSSTRGYNDIDYIPSQNLLVATSSSESGISYFSESGSVNSNVNISGAWDASFNPFNQLVYVSAGASGPQNFVYILNGSAILSKLSVGNQPWGFAYDPSNDYAYVTNFGSGSVSIMTSGLQVAIQFSP